MKSTSISRPAKKPSEGKKNQERKKIGLKTKIAVLTESGYRCAVPTCREILLLDLHHMYQVADGGSDEPSNLIALCPTCHARYHRGEISTDAIYAYKAMLIAIGRAFDVQTIDKLMFLESLEPDFLVVSGDGLLHFDRVIAANLATAEQKANNNFQLVTYAINISAKGKMLVTAWKTGNISDIQKSL
ncbi:MAG TPA: HNH endonuclease signature motif containing protein [Patescibacteria group bacterium]|nr:HNH endonuclease signature motif containing protein [Patescibacteria group bacterium]